MFPSHSTRWHTQLHAIAALPRAARRLRQNEKDSHWIKLATMPSGLRRFGVPLRPVGSLDLPGTLGDP